MPEIIFETPRLIVRRIVADDLDAMYTVYSDADAMRWVDDGQPITRIACERWLQITLRNYRTRGYGMFAVLDRATNEVIGFCGLVHPAGQETAEIKYAFRREYWGRGIATETASALLSYGASELGINYVIATVAPENRASSRVLLKVGMRHARCVENDDGSLTQCYEWQGRQSDSVRMKPRR